METENNIPLEALIPFSGYEYLYLFKGVLAWKSEGWFTQIKDDKKRLNYSAEKGVLEISCLNGLSIIFDSQSNYFGIQLFFQGNVIMFKTKDRSEAETLFNKIQGEKYNFYSPFFPDVPDVEISGLTSSQS